MAQQTATTTVPEFERTDREDGIKAVQTAVDKSTEWDVAIESDTLSRAERERLATGVNYCIARATAVTGDGTYVTGKQYSDAVAEWAEEYAAALDNEESWVTDMAPVDAMLELIAPSVLNDSGYGRVKPAFWILWHSPRANAGWAQSLLRESPHDDLSEVSAEQFLDELQAEQGWTEVLENMAVAAAINDVAARLNQDGYDVDLGTYGE